MRRIAGRRSGEGALGIRLQGSYGVLADTAAWSVTIALEFRVPLLLGILFFWADKP
jgi:hypothetical protein